MNTYKVPETFINHGQYHSGKDLFPSLIFRELCQNLWDSKQDNKPAKKIRKGKATQGKFEDIINEPQPRILLSTCVHPSDTNIEYYIAMTNAKPFEDAETLESRIRFGVSGENSGHQGSGIFASGIMASYGDMDALEVIYLSKGKNDFFGVAMQGQKPNILSTRILSKKETNEWIKHLKALYTAPSVFETKPQSKDYKTQTGKELFEETTVISLFRYNRQFARDRASDNSPVNVNSIGALMALSEAAIQSKVLFTPSVVFGSEKYHETNNSYLETNISKGVGNQLHLAISHNANMKDFSDKECTVQLNNVPIPTNTFNDEIEYWDFTLRFRKVKHMESSGTRTHKTVGANPLKSPHYSRMLPISFTLTVDDSKLNVHQCERKSTDPMYMEQVRGSGCYAQDFCFSTIELKEADKNVKNVLQKMSQLLGFTVEPAKTTSQKRKYILKVFQQVDIIAKPHKDIKATGGIWLDFFAEYPDKVASFLKNLAKEFRARENAPEMTKFKAYRAEFNEEIAAVSDDEDFISYMDSKISRRLGVIQVIPVTINRDDYGDPTDVVLGEPITTLQKAPYGTPRSLNVAFKQNGKFLDPRTLRVRAEGIKIDCSMTEGLSIQFAQKLKGAMIATLKIEPLTFVTNNKTTLVKDEDHFHALYAVKYVNKPKHFPLRTIKVSHEQNLFNLSYVLDIPSRKPGNEGKGKGSTGHGKPTKNTTGQKHGSEYKNHDNPEILCVYDGGIFKLNSNHYEINQTRNYMRYGDKKTIEDFKRAARFITEKASLMKESIEDRLNIYGITANGQSNENMLEGKYAGFGVKYMFAYILDLHIQELYKVSLQPIIHRMIKHMDAVPIQEDPLDEAA